MIRYFFITFLFITTSHAQNRVCIVLDSLTSEPVEYTSIEIPHRKVLANAAKDGTFTIAPEEGDLVVFSCVGYKTKKINWTNSDQGIIKLARYEKTLLPVVLPSRKVFKKETLGDYEKCSFSWYSSGGLVKQVAQEYIAPKDCFLREVRVCRGQLPFSPGGNALYRLRIYSKDTITGSPGEELFFEPIEVKSRSNTDKIDLDDRSIFIPKGSFFIAIEWLHIEENKVVKNARVNGIKKEHISFKPGIGLEIQDDTTDDSEIWNLTALSGWFKSPPNMRRLRIAAIIKY